MNTISDFFVEGDLAAAFDLLDITSESNWSFVRGRRFSGSIFQVDAISDYTGPSFFSVNSIYNDGCVPVYPKTEHWETVDGDQKTSHSCTMIPLQIKLCLDYLESTRADHKVKDCCGYW